MWKRQMLAVATVLAIQPALSAAEDCLVPLALQNSRAIAIGESYYLPKACTGSLNWIVQSAPSGSLNQVFNAGNEHPRFTPDLAGSYLFVSEDGRARVEMTAVQRSHAERFRNHYLTPLYGATQVGADLWTANGASYSVTRVHQDAQGHWQKTAEIEVGSWPAAILGSEKLPYVLVAQRGADSVGFVDRSRNLLTDALWVGDEPSGLALSPDATTLYVSLATERSIAVVDLVTRTLKPRISVGFDPRALALSADGKTLYAASYRSANLENGPGGSRPSSEDQDIFVIDTATQKMVRTLHSVAADLRALALSPTGDRLYVAGTDGQTLPSQADPTAKPFTHLVASIALGTDTESLQLTDLTRQNGSRGPFVNPSGIAVQGDQLWVSAESSDQVLVLDRASMSERFRVGVCSGPRQLVVMKDAVAVHCFQSFQLAILNFDGTLRQIISLSDDPRPAAVALGEKVFNRPGSDYAANHSCSSCHVETQNDGMIWRFGSNIWHNVRPLQLLAATTPLEWGAYASNTDSFGFMGPTSIVNRPATTEEAEGLAAFLSSLLGAPRATDRTQLDGSYSPLALQGKALFEGKGKCVSCHVPPLYTNRKVVPKGKSGEPADVPSLLGVYRHGIYFMKGQSRRLEDAVDVATAFVGWSANADEKAALLAFLKELTPKGSHPLGIFPDMDNNEMIRPESHPSVAFADVVDDTRPNQSAAELAQASLSLQDASGVDVPFQVSLQGGRVEMIPDAPLQAGERYVFRVKAGLPFRDGGILEGDRVSAFTVGRPPLAALPKNLLLKVFVPAPGPTVPPPIREVLLPLHLEREDANGWMAKLDLGGGSQQTLRLFQDAERIRLQPFALPIQSAPNRAPSLADASAVTGTVRTDAEQPGVFAGAEGTLTIGAPGLKLPGVVWTLTPVPVQR